ncbi:PQQ-binding-like beta-propeller repeat protein [Streptomyces sp. NPDC053755]|uniref:outer membrane protein assembly factor BamB family protein n=1 Tax=Streptomyces sp. NPDC053755 TaxID=3155815 RepID=UPI003417A09E
MVSGIALGVVGGIAALVLGTMGYLPGNSMSAAWQTPEDRKATANGNGAWLVGDTVVRSRFDAVTGFDAGSGKQRWEYTVPGRSEICAVGSAVEGGVGLIAHGEPSAASASDQVPPGKGCNTVTALDLTSGRELWHTARVPGVGLIRSEPDLVAAGGGLAVFREGDALETATEPVGNSARTGHGVRAVDLRTGAPRWRAAVPHGCVPRRVAATARQVLAVLACDGAEQKLAAFDPADGRARWTVPLRARPAVPLDEGAVFVSADPAVVRIGTGNEGGAFLAFGPDGRAQGQIEAGGDYGQLVMGDPGRVAVDGGRLLTVAHYSTRLYSADRVVAFDLAGGGELWRSDPWSTDQDISTLHAANGRLTLLLGSGRNNNALYVLDAADGDEKDDRSFHEETGGANLLFRHRDTVIAARWGQDARPFTAYRPW